MIELSIMHTLRERILQIFAFSPEHISTSFHIIVKTRSRVLRDEDEFVFPCVSHD